ncbi:MAG: hypothetical protein H0U53_10845 [Actinobacteria bacterium]|nr:hypothetical protein [Actinomycetota bacterium]
MAGRNRRLEMYELGVAYAVAHNEPKKLKRLLDDPNRKVTATGMIAIPKKRKGLNG